MRSCRANRGGTTRLHDGSEALSTHVYTIIRASLSYRILPISGASRIDLLELALRHNKGFIVLKERGYRVDSRRPTRIRGAGLYLESYGPPDDSPMQHPVH